MKSTMGLILFFGFAILVAVLIIFLGKGKKEKSGQSFDGLMADTLKKAVPQAQDCKVVMAQGSKDTLSALKDGGGELLAKASVKLAGAALGQNLRLRTSYASPPYFILGYNSQELYAVCVGEHPTKSELVPDGELVLHMTPANLAKITFGMGGKITFVLKDTKATLIVTVTTFGVPMQGQPENCKEFTAFIKEFAQKYDLG